MSNVLIVLVESLNKFALDCELMPPSYITYINDIEKLNKIVIGNPKTFLIFQIWINFINNIFSPSRRFFRPISSPLYVSPRIPHINQPLISYFFNS